jgi:acetoin utilization deacetylase AcuC-like enzyme
MHLYYCDHFVSPLPEQHRFPMVKYALLRHRVVESGLGGEGSLHVPPAATDSELNLVHDAEYLRKVREGELSSREIRRMGFPWSPELLERSRRSVGGTLEAGKAALRDGVAVNLSGGTHHAFSDRGEGFCVFNDVAVAARALQREGKAHRVTILDLDVHQGNGTAAIFSGDSSVFTLSVHGANNFPFRKERSDMDLELPDGAGDDRFLEATREGVQQALARSAADLAFFVAGADPFSGDRLGRLHVSKEALRARDEIVFEESGKAGLPVAVVMGGGYAPLIEDTVDIHFATVCMAASHHQATGVES